MLYIYKLIMHIFECNIHTVYIHVMDALEEARLQIFFQSKEKRWRL